MFSDISPIEDHTGNLALDFLDYELHTPKYTVAEARQHDANYSAPIYVKLRFINKNLTNNTNSTTNNKST